MRKYVIPLLFVAAISCSKIQKNEPVTKSPLDSLIVIDLEANITNYKEIPLSEISDSIIYIPLETSKKSIIGKVFQYGVYDDAIIINTLNEVIVFNRAGKFINKIGRRGKGPNEFNYANSVDYYNNYISILTTNKVLEFSKNNRLIRRIGLSQSGDQIMVLSPNSFAQSFKNSYGNADYILQTFNDKGEVLLSKSPVETFKFTGSTLTHFSGFEKSFSRFKSDVLFREEYNDTVYAFKSDYLLTPKYHVNLGKYKIPIHHRLEYLNDEDKFKKVAQNYLKYSFLEASDYIFLNYHSRSKGFGSYSHGFATYFKNDQTFFSIGHKEQGKAKSGFLNDVDGGLGFIPEGTTSDGRIAHVLIYPYELKSYFKSSKNKILSGSQLEELLDNIQESDNPVLMLVKLKE